MMQKATSMFQLKLRKWTWLSIGLVVYLLLTATVFFCYQDDVDQMTWVDREAFNHKLISQYKLTDNLTQDDVMRRLGTPDITEAVLQGKDLYQVLYYRTHRSVSDGITTADECTALLFKNRYLQAIGEEAVQRYTVISGHAN
jgi:hypothetical protein